MREWGSRPLLWGCPSVLHFELFVESADIGARCVVRDIQNIRNLFLSMAFAK
ncbi:Unannotated [Lentimonas sp. CC4]|nr:Unannotated [Lentimonas sp. CC4]CAA6684921.1 Unannotated [Lentimonas sp. CC6]CAA7077966.1 Unannotated [Lentimonas sp. CC4]CAA7169887.1 Unannotated [Lentimonas sp. CC21]CAA7181457.1 Unannotated [Lentimonas sp. CC8]